MTKKCDAVQCFTSSARSEMITCLGCQKRYHLKCVGLTNQVHKMIRDIAGIQWFCPCCRNCTEQFDLLAKHPVLIEITHRFDSLSKLVCAQIEVTRSLCRSLHRPTRTAEYRSNTEASLIAPDTNRDLDDAITSMNFEFSNIFAPFIPDGHPSARGRERTSSCSQTSTMRRRMHDASVDTTDLSEDANNDQPLFDSSTGQNTALAFLHAAPSPNVAAIPLTHITNNNTAPALLPPASASDTIFAVDSGADLLPANITNNITAPISTPPATTTIVTTASSALYTAANITNNSSHTTTAATNFAAAVGPVGKTPSIITASGNSRAANPSNNLILSNENHTSNIISHAQHGSALESPTLSVYIRNSNMKWYYLTPFEPNETAENVIRFITHKTNCPASSIICRKLVKHNRDESKPLTFISFRLHVPDSFCSTIETENFWPIGVKITRFLDRSLQRTGDKITLPSINNPDVALPSSQTTLSQSISNNQTLSQPRQRRTPLPSRPSSLIDSQQKKPTNFCHRTIHSSLV